MLQYLMRVDNVEFILFKAGFVDVVDAKLQVTRFIFFHAHVPFTLQSIRYVYPDHGPGFRQLHRLALS